MEINVKFTIFSVFMVFKHDFSDELILPVSQFQTRHQLEYLTQIYYNLVLIL